MPKKDREKPSLNDDLVGYITATAFLGLVVYSLLRITGYDAPLVSSYDYVYVWGILLLAICVSTWVLMNIRAWKMTRLPFQKHMSKHASLGILIIVAVVLIFWSIKLIVTIKG